MVKCWTCESNPYCLPQMKVLNRRLIWSQGHILPFGSQLYVEIDERDIKNPKFDPPPQAMLFLGHGFHGGGKCLKGYSFDLKNKGHRWRIMYSTHTYSDTTYFPSIHLEMRVKNKWYLCQEQAIYLEKKLFVKPLDREIPIPPETRLPVNLRYGQTLQKCNTMFRH